MQSQHEFVPAAAGLLHNTFNLGAHGLPLAHFRAGKVHGVFQFVHVLAGAFFFKTLLAFVLKQHFPCFKRHQIHALHASGGAKLAGLFVQFRHMGRVRIASALKLQMFHLAAFCLRPGVRYAASHKANAAEKQKIAGPQAHRQFNARRKFNARNAHAPVGQQHARAAKKESKAQNQQRQIFYPCDGRLVADAGAEFFQPFALRAQGGGKGAQLAQGKGLPVQILAGGAVYVALFFAQGFHAALDCGNLFLRLAHVLRGIVRLTHFFLHISGEGEGFFLPRKERIKQGFCLSAVTCAVDHQPQRIESSGKCCFCFVHRTLAQGALAAGFFLPGKGLTQVVAGIVIQRAAVLEATSRSAFSTSRLLWVRLSTAA